MKNQTRKEEMAAMLSLQRDSGLSKRAFCKKHKINPATFYYWQRRLQGQEQEQRIEGFSRINILADNWIKVRLPGGTEIELSSAAVEQVAYILIAIDKHYD